MYQHFRRSATILMRDSLQVLCSKRPLVINGLKPVGAPVYGITSSRLALMAGSVFCGGESGEARSAWLLQAGSISWFSSYTDSARAHWRSPWCARRSYRREEGRRDLRALPSQPAIERTVQISNSERAHKHQADMCSPCDTPAACPGLPPHRSPRTSPATPGDCPAPCRRCG